MFKASTKDKETVVSILSNSFDDNKSVNYIIPQDKRRENRLRELMAYSFDICMLFGEVYLTEDRKACGLILLPDHKKQNLKSISLDARLAFKGVGLSNVGKAMKREAAIRKIQPVGLLYYIWFIGVQPQSQGAGTGTKLLKEILNRGGATGRTICLETSTQRNIPWYEKHGFSVYQQLDFGYPLYCLKQEGLH